MGCILQSAFVSDGATKGDFPGSLQAPAARFVFVPRTVQSHESLSIPAFTFPQAKHGLGADLIFREVVRELFA